MLEHVCEVSRLHMCQCPLALVSEAVMHGPGIRGIDGPDDPSALMREIMSDQ